MKPFNHLNIELAGPNLIEASAGTGKTHAIACLYLRLLVEHGLAPEQILVVTFTEAATAELRGRIRSRIRESLEVFSGAGSEDPFLLGLRDNVNGLGPDSETARRRLDLALRCFDLAAIQTIHGFCMGALRDNAFESGLLYDTELVADQMPLFREIADDFWRSSFFGETAPLLDYALGQKQSPDTLARFLARMLGGPKQRVVPSFTSEGIENLDARLSALHGEVAAVWRERREELVGILLTHKGLSRSAENYRQDLLEPLIALMDAYLAGSGPCSLFPGFGKFTRGGILAAALKKHPSPEDPFFDRCGELAELVGERFLALKWSLLEFARQRLPRRKQELNVRCFDDLLSDLWLALEREGGERLAARIGEGYGAALIDEFQDTDPVQYDIFRKVFGGGDKPLFLIGDPKQAIYSFRGADIFAYLEAAGDIDEERRFTLDTNWRSAPLLLEAVNRIFGEADSPFVFDRIAYQQVKSGRPGLAEALRTSGENEAPFHVWFVPTESGADAESSAESGGEGAGSIGTKKGEGKKEKLSSIKVGEANRIIPRAVTAEIARLLRNGREGRTLIEGRPLMPEDVAVIVRTHRQARLVQEELLRLGIPNVLRSSESIIASAEAQEMLILLGALADPGSEPLVRAALVTDILGRNGDDLIGLLEDEYAWSEMLATFREYHDIWRERGFIVMSRLLTAREGVRGRLLAFPDGERRLTNYLHCLEVLHQAALEKRLGMEGLVSWLGARIREESERDEYQLRLETDEKAVRIVTVHVSKGLEYPVVFCPFAWDGVKGGGESVACHVGPAIIRDFGSSAIGRHRQLAAREELAENLRLLYVALTRAKFRCYLVGGRFRNAETSALAWLFHRPDGLDPTRDDLVERLGQAMAAVSSSDMLDHYTGLAGGSGGAISLSQLAEPDETPGWSSAETDTAMLACRQFRGHIDHGWRVTSFTSFSASGHRAVEHPDRDEADPSEVPAAPPMEARGMDIFSFPRGAKPGTLLHEIFEKLDFTDPSPMARQLVEEGLNRYGYDGKWLNPLLGMVENVTCARLPDGGDGFSLSGLSAGSWLAELEFFFPLAFISADRLRSCLSGWVGEGYPEDLAGMLESLEFTPARGMVHGFIDMLFCHGGRYYLIDWKSNWLGGRPEEYNRERLAAEMARKFYPLQYLLYTVAINRFLALRQPGYDYDTHFGGVYYLFLRGMDRHDQSGPGIFHDRPPKGLVEELTALLVECGGGSWRK